MSKGLWKRALAMVLALTLWIELVPVNVWASVSEAIEEAVEETAAEETAAVESDTEEAAVKGATEEATDETVEEVAEEAVDESVEEIAEAEVDESSEEGADSGIAVISETTDFTYSVVDSATITITGYSGTDTNVVIPATFEDLPVTSIGASAFAGNTTMTSVTVPDGVLVIGKNAFSGCSALTTAILPDSVTTMGYQAFCNCTSLTSVNYPINWTKTLNYYNNEYNSIDCGQPFYGCTALTDITVPEGVTVIAANAFTYSSVKNVSLPSTLTTISRYAFYRATNLTNINIPEGVTAIGDQAFCYCTSLAEIEIPESLTSLPTYCFANCTSLEKVTLPDTLTTLYKGVFKKCIALTEIELPDAITDLGYRVFESCTNLTTVNYPLNWTKTLNINNSEYNNIACGQPFWGCTALTEITVPEGVTVIAPNAFTYASIESVSLPSTLTTISRYAFYYATKLTDITIPEGVTEIGDEAFGYCTSLTEIEIPKSLTYLSTYCFANCTSLENVTLPDTLTTLYKGVFKKCIALTEIELPDAITDLGYRVFESCTSLETVNYPLNWTKTLNINNIEYNNSECGAPFYGCTALTSMDIPEGVTTIPANAFAYSSIEELTWPGTLTTISRYAFFSAIQLEIMTIPSTVTAIGEKAFANCSGLEMIILPEKVTLGTNALLNCPNLTVHCPLYSWASVAAINYGYPMVNTKNTKAALGNVTVDSSVSSYEMDLSYLNISGYINNTIEYTLTSAKASKYVIVYLADSVLLKESTLYVDGELCTNYTLDGNLLTIPVSNTSGKIQFYTEPQMAGEVRGYVLFQYYDGGNKQEVLDVFKETISDLTISVKDITSSADIKVSGIAPKSTTVELYVDGQLVKSTASSKAGKYSTTVTIPNPVEGRKNIVKAVCTSGDNTYEAQTTVLYQESCPEVTEFNLYYNNHQNTVLNLLETEKNQHVYFYPGVPFTFTIDFSNQENVETVYVTSTRNNETRYMKAEYDASRDLYVASGYFDENNRSYVPGTLAVKFNCAPEETFISEDFDVSSYADTGVLSEKTTVSTTQESDGSTTYHVDMTEAMTSIGKDVGDTILDFNVSMLDEVSGSYIGDLLSDAGQVKDMFSYFVPGLDDSRYIVSADFKDARTYILWVKDAGDLTDSVVQYKISLQPNDAWTSLDDFAQELSGFNTTASVVYDVAGFYKDYEDLCTEIRQSNHIQDKAGALKRANQLYGDQVAYTVMVAALGAMSAATGGNEKVLEKTGHTLVTDKAVEATCENAGLTEGSHCSTCNAVITEQKTIAAFGHSYETVLTKATTSADGLSKEVCATCGDVKNEETIYKISSVSLSTTAYTYNGKKKSPIVTVKDSEGNKLTKYEDYTVTFGSTKRTAIGRYSVKVTFKGNYSGTKTVYFTIGPKNPTTVKAVLYGHDDIKVTWTKVSGASGYKVYYKKSTSSTWSSKSVSSSVTSVKLKNRTDGVKYNIKVVAYKTKSGNECYNAGKSTSIYTLKKVSGVKVAKSSTKVKVSWTNISGETGYQISQSTKKTGTNIVYTYASSSGKSKTISATKGKTYYYKVRAYKKVTIDGKTKIIYGPWSTTVKYVRK